MDIKDLLEDIENLTDRDLKRRFDSLMIRNYKFKNLDKKNRELVWDIIKKFQKYKKRHISIGPTMIRRELYAIKRNQFKLGLDDADIDDIEEIIKEFRG